MAKWIGNSGVPNTYPTTDLPSAVDGPPKSQFAPRSEFRTDECIHKHADPIGEGLTQSKRQYRNPGYLEEKGNGPKLNRATPRQYAGGADADGAARAGKIGSGFEGGSQKSNRMGDDADHGSPLAAALLRGEDPWSR